MRTTIRRSGVAILATTLLATLAAVLTWQAPVATAAVTSPRLVLDRNFPDPGFAKFGSRYYLYGTGLGFPVSSSTSPTSGYTTPTYSMPRDDAHQPAWADTAPTWGGKRLWAPQVFASSVSGKRIYVMYFTAYDAQKGANCVGTAVSSYPDRYFSATSQKICAPSAGREAIDPTPYLSAGGNRYLIYKSSLTNTSDWRIHAIPMDSTGRYRSGTADRTKIGPAQGMASRMESPSVLLHGGKVWIFTSRGDYVNCTYSTDAWSADSLWDGTFTKVRTVMTTSSTGKCGPGGAAVIQDGTTTRIAFHAWKNNDPATKIRRPYVGDLYWSSGRPYLR